MKMIAILKYFLVFSCVILSLCEFTHAINVVGDNLDEMPDDVEMAAPVNDAGSDESLQSPPAVFSDLSDDTLFSVFHDLPFRDLAALLCVNQQTHRCVRGRMLPWTSANVQRLQQKCNRARNEFVFAVDPENSNMFMDTPGTFYRDGQFAQRILRYLGGENGSWGPFRFNLHENDGQEKLQKMRDCLEAIEELANPRERQIPVSFEIYGTESFKEVLTLFNNYKNLAVVSLAYKETPLYSLDVQVLSSALRSATNLRTLFLDRNEITSDETRMILAALIDSPSLERLDIWNNPLEPHGAHLVTNVMARTPLKGLYLLGTKLGPEGGRILSRALEQNSQLTNLNLFDNEIGNHGLQALVEAALAGANRHPNLHRKLELGMNGIDQDTRDRISNLVRNHNTLTVLL